MQIYIRTLTNKIAPISCSPGDTVDDIKIKAERELGIPRSDQRLVCNGKTLMQETMLKDACIKDGDTVTLLIIMRGGGFPGLGFNFASMESGSKIQFSADAPDYRIIGPGLNLEGRCMDEKCKAFKQLAWSPLGFSRSLKEVDSPFDTAGFNIGSLINNTPCPLCKKPMNPDSIVSCGFFRCQYTYQGYQQGENSVIKGSGKAEDYDGIEYHNGIMDSKTWTMLVIVVNCL